MKNTLSTYVHVGAYSTEHC